MLDRVCKTNGQDVRKSIGEATRGRMVIKYKRTNKKGQNEMMIYQGVSRTK